MSIEQQISEIGSAEVMIVLDQGALMNRADGDDAPERLGPLIKHFVPAAGEVHKHALNELKADDFTVLLPHANSLNGILPVAKFYPNLGIMLGSVNASGLTALRADALVENVVPAPKLSLVRPVRSVAVNDPQQLTWGLQVHSIPEVWNSGYTGKGVFVGHLDTGIDGGHPAMNGAIHAFAQFDSFGNPVDGAAATDSGDHGTHTAGTIAGRKVGATVFGVAPEAQLVSAMVIEGGQVTRRILAGMDWIVGQNVRILNMSLGLQGYDASFATIMRILRAKNILPVICIGNDGLNTSRSPGNYVEALSVGALDPSMIVSGYSSSQHFDRADKPIVPDIVAAGAAVLSCVPGQGYAEKYGTSQATAHISGLAALLLQARPDATASDLEQAIIATAFRPATISEDRGNHGIPSGPASLAYILSRTS